jgi:hypothetical protein
MNTHVSTKSDNKSKYKEIRKGRNHPKMNPLLVSLPSSGSFRTTLTKTWRDGSVYSNSTTINTQDLWKSEREMKKLVNYHKLQKRSSLGDLHTQMLKQSYDNNFKSIYITDEKGTKGTISSKGPPQLPRIKIEKDYFSRNKNFDLTLGALGNFGNLKSSLTSREQSHQMDSYRQRPEFTINQINSMYGEKRMSNSNFLQTTRNLSRTKFLIGFKKEHAVRLKEDYENELGEIYEKIQTSKEIDIFLKDSVDEKFNKYCFHVFKQKEHEKTELEKLEATRHNIDLDMKKINHSISKLKINYDRLIEYRNFLICVKERKINLPSHFLNSVYEETNNDKFSKLVEKINCKTIQPPYISPKLSMPTLALKKKTSIIMPKRNAAGSFQSQDFELKNELAQEISRYSRYLSYPVYSSVDEFLNDFNRLEIENLTLIHKYNENNQIMFEMTQEYTRLLNEERNIQKLYTNNILKNEEKLKEVLDRNKTLVEEKQNLMHEIVESNYIGHRGSVSYESPNMMMNSLMNSNYSSHSQRKKKHSINSKINEIYKNIFSLLPHNFYEKNSLNNLVNSKVPENTEKLKLREIEKIFNTLLEKYSNYKTNKEMNKKVIECEMRMEKDRKDNKAKELKIKEDLKRKEMQKEISEKESDFIILPRRKTVERFKPMKRNRKNSVEIFTRDDEEFDKYISFGEGDSDNN